MPNTREKLIELLCNTPAPEVVVFGHRCGKALVTAEFVADHLIAHGVTVHGDKDINVPSKWISVKDRLPDKHDRYLCNVKAFSFPDLRYFAILKYDDGGFIEGKIYTDDVTHWMPLPEPPKGE